MNSILHRVRFRRDHRWAPGHMSAYIDGDLASRARLRLERHTGECAECRGVFRILCRMVERLRGLPVTPRETPDIASAVRRRLRDAASD